MIDCERVLEESQRGKYYAININGKSTPLKAYPDIPNYGYHIDRQIFNSSLLTEAVNSGVELIESSVNKLLTDSDHRIIGVKADNNHEYLADYVFDASGMTRFSGRRLKLKESYFSKEFIVSTGMVDFPGKKKEEFEFYPREKGWSWQIYADDGLLTWTSLFLKSDFILEPPVSLRSYNNTGKISAQNMTWRKFNKTALPGLIILGDAACVIDPASGQGVHTAVLSAVRAVNTLQKILLSKEDEGALLRSYEKWFHTYFMAKCTELKAYYKLLGIKFFD